MKWFGNDKQGFTIQDLEKVVLCAAFLGEVTIVCILAAMKIPLDSKFTDFTLLTGLMMVGRKGLSYWKPKRYGDNGSLLESVKDALSDTQEEVKEVAKEEKNTEENKDINGSV
jgi:hypothetical protein